MTLDAGLIGQLLSSTVLAAILVQALNGLLNRRKLGADAAEAITRAAGGVVETLQADNSRLRSEVEQLRLEVVDLRRSRDESEQREDEWREVLHAHAAFDYVAVRRIRESDPSFPDPPPLWPAATDGAHT